MTAAARKPAATKPAPVPVRWSRPEPMWAEIETAAPQMAATMTRYMAELGGLLTPASVTAAGVALRQFAGRVTAVDPRCTTVAAIGRRHVEDYLVWLAARPGSQWGTTVSAATVEHRVGLVVKFFERLVTWDYADKPEVIPIVPGIGRSWPGRRESPAGTGPRQPKPSLALGPSRRRQAVSSAPRSPGARWRPGRRRWRRPWVVTWISWPSPPGRRR